MNSSTNVADTAATAGIMAGIGIYFLFLFAMIALFIWFYWRIFSKAGYNGALSLLNLVPGVGSLVCILILAFGRWPIEDVLAANAARVPGGTAPPPGSTLST